MKDKNYITCLINFQHKGVEVNDMTHRSCARKINILSGLFAKKKTIFLVFSLIKCLNLYTHQFLPLIKSKPRIRDFKDVLWTK